MTLALSVFLSTLGGAAVAAPALWSERPLLPAPERGSPFSFDTFSLIAARATPAVVSIETASGHSDFSAWSGLFELPRQRRGAGSGFIINAAGYLLTNYHVIENATNIRVHLQSGAEEEAEVVGVDPETDLALLKISASSPLPAVPLGDSDQLKIGEWVLAIGNPLELSHTVTAGIVSAKERRQVNPDGRLRYANFIQTDASINPGNSGGPLFNLSGQVIGINTAVSARGQGIGFAIPINMVKQILSSLREHGRVRRSWLGVSVRTRRDRSREGAGAGAEIVAVAPGSPAERAGLAAGDLILRFGRHQIEGDERLSWLASVAGIGQVVTLQIERGGRRRRVRVVLGELPGRFNAQRQGRAERGAPLRALDRLDFQAREVTLRGEQRLQVSAVQERSPAARAGLRVGDIILQCSAQTVHDLRQLTRAIESAGRVLRLQILRAGQISFIAYERAQR